MKLIAVDVEIAKEDLRGKDSCDLPKTRRATLTVVYSGDEKEILAVANDLAKEMVK